MHGFALKNCNNEKDDFKITKVRHNKVYFNIRIQLTPSLSKYFIKANCYSFPALTNYNPYLRMYRIYQTTIVH